MKKKHETRKGPWLMAAMVAATAVALWLGRAEESRPATSAETLAPAAEVAPDPVAPRALPPGHPPLDGAPEAAPPLAGQLDEDAVLPPGHPPIGAQSADSAPPNATSAEVTRVEGGLTVAEIFRDAASLRDRKVLLRARVMKATANVLGKTWLHVQDGTGDPGASTHDLVVTTTALPVVGSEVVLEGTVVTDKDLGSGYRYAVLLENATIREGTAAD